MEPHHNSSSVKLAGKSASQPADIRADLLAGLATVVGVENVLIKPSQQQAYVRGVIDNVSIDQDCNSAVFGRLMACY